MVVDNEILAGVCVDVYLWCFTSSSINSSTLEISHFATMSKKAPWRNEERTIINVFSNQCVD